MLQADVAAVGRIASDAFIEDDLFAWLHPRRHTHRASWDSYVMQRCRRRIHEPALHSFVAVLDHRDAALGPVGTVIGYAFWERIGPKDNSTAFAWRQTNTSFVDWLERKLIGWEMWYTDLARLDSSVERSRVASLIAAFAHQDDYFNTHAPEHWHLRVLGVAPKYQRKGVGHLLVEWGLQNAKREDVPAALEASTNGGRLYAKLGFKTVSWMTVGGVAETTSKVMVYDAHERTVREAIGPEKKVQINGREQEVEVVWRTDVTPADVALAKTIQADSDTLGSEKP